MPSSNSLALIPNTTTRCSTYAEDVVRLRSLPAALLGFSGSHSPEGENAVVLRTWLDESAHALTEEERTALDFKLLKEGELEIMNSSGKRSIVLESETTLIDRGFLVGDLVRPVPPPSSTPSTSQRGQAGILTHLKTEVQLKWVLADKELEGWFDANEVVAALRIARGDHVVYVGKEGGGGGWVGVVEEVFEMAMVETDKNGELKRVCDTGASLQVGATAENLQLDQNLFPAATGNLTRVIDVKHVVLAINWLCMNTRKLDPDMDTARPKRYWNDLDNGQIALVRGAADHLHSLGDKVVFRGSPPSPPPPIDSSQSSSASYASGSLTLVVTNTRSTASVLYQDGTTVENISTVTIEHCLNLDEDVDVFPGDVGVFSGAGGNEKKPAVVQRMDSRKRTVVLRWLNPKTGIAEEGEGEETVSGLEFDPHGPPPEVYGVRRGDPVLVGPDDTSGNGVELPTVPRLGESEVLIGAFPSPEALRVELSSRGLKRLSAGISSEGFRPLISSPISVPTPSPSIHPSVSAINWYGIVTSLLPSGLVIVRFPSGVEETVKLGRLFHLDDGMDPGSMGDIFGMGSEDGWTDEEGEGGEGEGEGEEWETDDDEEMIAIEVDSGDEEDGEDEEMVDGEEGSEGEEWRRRMREEESDEEDSGVGWAEAIDQVDKEMAEQAPTNEVKEKEDMVKLPDEVEEDENWKRFVVLEEAPIDHHYKAEAIQVPSKAFMARIRKEYNVLATSLPPNILVRAYEDRTDLLRCLIIGPIGTPFQNAPFVFDIFLPPSKFPHEPPSVYFHSWAGGTRVSPNLYAEGKVCLSLLGTWSGDKNENWSAARSSILQIFVSIQALIMVECPDRKSVV